jgi:uncharacterized protein YyaL (SSP411 family)
MKNTVSVQQNVCKAVMIYTFLNFVFLQTADAQKKSGSPDKESYAVIAENFYAKIWSLYRVPEYGLFAEYYPQKHTDTLTYLQQGAESKKVCYLWPLSGIFSSTNVLMQTPAGRKKYKPFLDSVVFAMEHYRDASRTPAGYQAYPVRFEKVDRYYDDNGLVGIDYVDAYENTGNKVYLERAKSAFAFIISGWSDDLGGGVSWLEGVRDQKPACSNGMATLVALKLYKATKDKYYLDWGRKFYNWMKCLRDENGIYANDIKTADSSVNKVYYTYNSGSMLIASTLLYEFTKDKSYLAEAKAIAEASYVHFGIAKEGDRVSILDLPWFVTVLFRGYEALYRIDGNPKYVLTIKKNIDFAFKNSRDKYGLFYNNWNKEKDEFETAKWLLDEACMAELYARLAQLKLKD